MKEIIKEGIVQREKDYDYRIDRKGNLIREKYNYFKDWRTYLILGLLLMSYLYYSEVKQARDYVNSPCVHKCLIENYIQDFQANNPLVKINCDYEALTCQYSGAVDDNMRNQIEQLKRLNITISNG